LEAWHRINRWNTPQTRAMAAAAARATLGPGVEGPVTAVNAAAYAAAYLTPPRKPKKRKGSMPSPLDLSGGLGGGSASSTETVKKTRSRTSAVGASALHPLERPLTIHTQQSDRMHSVWKSLRDLVSGKKIVNNCFSFKMESETDKRGFVCIPLRHDGVLALKTSDQIGTTPGTQWSAGSQTYESVPLSTDFPQHTTMMMTPITGGTIGSTALGITQDPYSYKNTNNCVVPRLNLPTLEQMSWDANPMKMFPVDNGETRTRGTNGVPINSKYSTPRYTTLAQPMLQLGGGIPLGPSTGSGGEAGVDYSSGIPGPINSRSRFQDEVIRQMMPQFGGATPSAGAPLDMRLGLPMFETQLGGGSFKMQMSNQSTSKVTVEFIVIKVKNTKAAAIALNGQDFTAATFKDDFASELSLTWNNLKNTVGAEYAARTLKSQSYAMGRTLNASSTVGGPWNQFDKLARDCIENPYVPWLPSSDFKARYPKMNSTISEAQDYYGVDPASENGVVYNRIGAHPVFLEATAAHADAGGAIDGISQIGGGAQRTPYSVVSRGHATICGVGQRTVTIKLPAQKYNASRLEAGCLDQNIMQSDQGFGAKTIIPTSTQTFMVLVSINGSLQDVILPGNDDSSGNPSDQVKVIGKAYTAATVDFNCSYTESVLPAVCDYTKLPSTKYNLGRVTDKQVVFDTVNTDMFTGSILSSEGAVQVQPNAIQRSGATGRAKTQWT